MKIASNSFQFASFPTHEQFRFSISSLGLWSLLSLSVCRAVCCIWASLVANFWSSSGLLEQDQAYIYYCDCNELLASFEVVTLDVRATST